MKQRDLVTLGEVGERVVAHLHELEARAATR
jgi:hypothetical protein